MKKIQVKIIGIITIMVIILSSCSGGRMFIAAKTLEHPVSTTEGIYDQKLKLLSKDNYTVIDHFEFNLSAVSFFWTWIPISNHKDISDKLDNILKDKGGDAIVNLSIKTGTMMSGEAFLNFFSSVIPVLPGVVVAKVEGDVIKVKK